MAEVAACFDVLPAQIYAWRRELREMAEDAAREDRAMFSPAVIEPTSVPAVSLEPEAANARSSPDAVVQVAMEVRGFDAGRLGNRSAAEGAMIGPGSDAKVSIYTKPIDFRCGIDTSVAKVQHELSQDPWRGVAYIFRSKRKDRSKISWFDGTGIWSMTKRAEAAEGFAWPPAVDGSFSITAAQMAALTSGMDWHSRDRPSQSRWTRRYACDSMPAMDPSTASCKDPVASLATIAKSTAEAAERDQQIVRINAENEALARAAAQAEAREIIALATAKAAEHAAVIAEAKAAEMEDALAAARDEVKRLNDILDQFKRHRFGQSAERLDPDQYQLVLEELEAASSRAEAGLEAPIDQADATGETKRRRRNNRGASPAHLERIEQVVDIEDKQCACCGNDLHVIGEDVTERLDVVPTIFRVSVTRRPRYGCRGCDEGGVT
ncbi:hypothetical protein OY671_007452, partial [Metschnikowia pulcherrima]